MYTHVCVRVCVVYACVYMCVCTCLHVDIFVCVHSGVVRPHRLEDGVYPGTIEKVRVNFFRHVVSLPPLSETKRVILCRESFSCPNYDESL